MKKIYISGLILGTILSIAPLFTYAQTEAGNRKLLPPGSLRTQITDGVKENENSRNIMLQNDDRFGSSTASTTHGQKSPSDGPENNGERMRNASSTFASSTGERMMKENRKELRLDIFNKQKDHLVSQLERALDNLKNIRSRISSRITKAESSGRDMTKAKTLLATADAKLAAAQVAIDSVSSIATTTIASSTASSTASTTIVDLSKPRQIGADAIGAVKDAQKALNDVVRAIAHDMGLNLEESTTTATTTSL